MDFEVIDLLRGLFRWFHVVAGVLWIGLLYFFNFVNSSFAPTMDGDTKKKVVPQLMPRALYFFRWGAAWTWTLGLLLLLLNFYHFPKGDYPGGAPQPLEKGTGWGPFQLGMLALTILAPFVYDVLVKSVLKTGTLQFWGGFVLVCAAACGYQAAHFTPRASMVHLGAMLGTIMAFNVWFRIWPCQKEIITAVRDGQKPADATVAMAGARSKHNTFMSVPLIYLMLNEHNVWAPTTPVPWITMAFVLLAWIGVHHLYGLAKKVKGF